MPIVDFNLFFLFSTRQLLHTMAPTLVHYLAIMIALWGLLVPLVAAQACGGQWNTSTAIDGKPFPPLIEASVEDLVRGLEASLFTSVDLVNV